jgi:hypothetical protein
VDLTDFIKYISESENIVECEPNSFDKYSENNQDDTYETLKLVEYIFKIIIAFNDSFTSIYQEENEEV